MEISQTWLVQGGSVIPNKSTTIEGIVPETGRCNSHSMASSWAFANNRHPRATGGTVNTSTVLKTADGAEPSRATVELRLSRHLYTE